MSNDWKNFVVSTKHVSDLNGKIYTYQIPPAWKTELQIWEILESSPSLEVQDFDSALAAIDTVCQIVSILLPDLSIEDSIDNLFDSGTIESIFTDVWQSIMDSTPQTPSETPTSPHSASKKADFSIASALAMFACECGWMPEQVLSLPKIQVIQLTSAISEHTSQRMKFQAAIHGVPIQDDSASPSFGTQINIEDQIQDFQTQGLPVEVI